MNTYIRSLHRLKYYLALSIALTLTACATSTQARIYQGYGALTVSTKLIAGALTANQITVQDAENYSTIAKIALSILDRAQLAIERNDAPRADALLRQLDSALADIQQQLTLKGITK